MSPSLRFAQNYPVNCIIILGRIAVNVNLFLPYNLLLINTQYKHQHHYQYT